MKKSIGTRTLSKILSFYYGNPAKDMKLIVITDDAPSALPDLIQSIIITHGEKVAVVSASSVSSLHRAISKAWKKEANFVIISSPLKTLHNLPIHMIVANQVSSPTSFINDPPSTPDFLVLNRDDLAYAALKDHPVKTATRSYGHHRDANTHVDSSKPYKTAVEARLTVDGRPLDVAAFLTGDTAPALLAAATTVADLLGINKDTIVEGLASFEPEVSTPTKKKN
jgi:hypothetical protein